jgi:hypothetical protein
LFNECRDVQVKREQLLKELAELAQLYRDLQLKNVYLLEDIDEQTDQILELKHSIEFLKKEILTVRKRQVSYLSELYELYKGKDRELDLLAINLQMSAKERDLLEHRRDEGFSQLVDLMAERRQVLSQVQDGAELMSMRYVASRAEEQERRL